VIGQYVTYALVGAILLLLGILVLAAAVDVGAHARNWWLRRRLAKLLRPRGWG